MDIAAVGVGGVENAIVAGMARRNSRSPGRYRALSNIAGASVQTGKPRDGRERPRGAQRALKRAENASAANRRKDQSGQQQPVGSETLRRQDESRLTVAAGRRIAFPLASASATTGRQSIARIAAAPANNASGQHASRRDRRARHDASRSRRIGPHPAKQDQEERGEEDNCQRAKPVESGKHSNSKRNSGVFAPAQGARWTAVMASSARLPLRLALRCRMRRAPAR